MKLKTCLFAITGLMLLAPQVASAESLEDALALAYRSNPTIRAERARLRATEELKSQAWANALPQITAQGSYSHLNDTQSFNPAVFGTDEERVTELNPLTGAVTAQQPIFTGFRNYNAIRQAKARARAGGAQLAGVEQDILQRVATAYFDVVRDMANYESNVNNVEVLIRQKAEAELRFEVGEVTRTDVAQADARLAQSRAQLASAQAQLAVSRAVYAELVGNAPGTLDQTPPLPVLPETLDSAIALAMNYSPVVIAAREQEYAAKKEVSIAKGAFLPSISAMAEYQYADQPSSFVLQDESFTYGVRASVPIFLGGLNLSRVREARALHDSAIESIAEAERSAERATTSAYQQLIAARQTIESAKSQVEANELALRGVRREAQLGTRTTLDVLDAEQEFLNSKVSLSNAERNERVAAFALLAAAGVLNPDALGIDASRLIPEGDD